MLGSRAKNDAAEAPTTPPPTMTILRAVDSLMALMADGRVLIVYLLRFCRADQLTYEVSCASLHTTMSTLLVSSKGQIVLPAALRRRLGMGAGARLEVVEEADGVKLRIVRAVPRSDVASLAGMLTAPARGVPRRLEDFDPASLLARSRTSKP